MTQEANQTLRESIERRLIERYVSTVDASARSEFVGTSGHSDWLSVGATMVLGAWPRIKAVPLLGPAVYRVFIWLRKSGG